MRQLLTWGAFLFTLASQDPAGLVERLRSETIEEREEAYRKLKELGPRARKELEAAAKSPDAELSARAKILLRVIELRESLSPKLLEAVPGVEDRLAQGDDAAWTQVLLDVGGRDGRARYRLWGRDLDALAAPALRGARTTREKKAVILLVGEYRLASAAEELSRVAADVRAEGELRERAVGSLGSIDLKGHFRLILQLLKDPNRSVAGSAAQVLTREYAGFLLPEVLPLLKDEHAFARQAAVEAVAQHGGDGGLRQISPLLKDPDARVRLAVVHAYHTRRAKEQAGGLAAGLKDASPFVRGTTAYVLSDLGARDSAPELEETLRDPVAYVRFQAAEALYLLDGEDCLGPLLPLLKDPDRSVRLHVASRLVRIGSREAAPVFLEEESKGDVSFELGKDPATDIVRLGFEVPRPSALNALKEPALWRRLEKSRLGRKISGSRAEVLAALAAEAGLKLEPLPEGDGGAPALYPGSEYLRVLPTAIGAGADFLLTGESLRVLPLDEARGFWRAWWKRQK